MNHTKGEINQVILELDCGCKVQQKTKRIIGGDLLITALEYCPKHEAAPDNYLANKEYDLAIGKFIMALAGDMKLADAVIGFITPAQDRGRRALAKAEGK